MRKYLFIGISVILLFLSGYVYFQYYFVFGEGVKSGYLNYAVYKGNIFKTYESDVDNYFLGSIITVKSSDGSGYIDVVDGQQRLTTLMILFCILFSYKRNEKQKMQVTQHKLQKQCY